jgi:hypothetical protein
MQICLIGDIQAALIHASNGCTLRIDLVHTVEIVKCAYNWSWKLRRMSCMREAEEVKLY